MEAHASTVLDAAELPETSAEASPRRLASRCWRLFAIIIDGLTVIALELPLYWHFHVWHDVAAHQPVPYRVRMILGAVYIVVFVALNYRLLDKRGQTIGKWIVGVTIVGLDGSNKGAVHLLLYRFLPEMFLKYVPVVGALFALADGLAIFGPRRRCIHDHIAGTRVIETESIR